MKTIHQIDLNLPVDIAKSLAEEWTMRLLMCMNIVWEYEPNALKLPTGEMYVPDLYLTQLGTYVECKGERGLDLDSYVMGRAKNLHKPQLLSYELTRLGSAEQSLVVFVLHPDVGLLHVINDGFCAPIAARGIWSNWCANSSWVRCGDCEAWQPRVECETWMCRRCGNEMRSDKVLSHDEAMKLVIR